MVKVKEIKVFEVICPDVSCKHKFKTEKTVDIQCGKCGVRFDL